MEEKSLRILNKHCIVWAIFIAYEMSYVYLAGVSLSNFWDYALHYAVNICLFYCNSEGFKYLFRSKVNRYVGIALLIIIEISIYLLIEYSLFRFLKLINVHSRASILEVKLFFVQGIYRAVYFIGFSIAYWFAMAVAHQRRIILELENSKLRQENQNAELEKNLMKAKNAYLQSQLNPHLLFNTLNFIYNSVRKLSNAAAEAILILSDMMRYSLSDVGIDGKVPLKNEIDHIRNLVKLNQLRFNEKLLLKLRINGSLNGEVVIPLLLISFVENIYKHGDLMDIAFPAEINITCENHILQMTCLNKQKKSAHQEGWGIGIENARTRLTNYYQERFKLNILDNELGFHVFLLVEL